VLSSCHAHFAPLYKQASKLKQTELMRDAGDLAASLNFLLCSL